MIFIDMESVLLCIKRTVYLLNLPEYMQQIVHGGQGFMVNNSLTLRAEPEDKGAWVL